MNNVSLKDGGNQIEFEDEDSKIRALFEEDVPATASTRIWGSANQISTRNEDKISCGNSRLLSKRHLEFNAHRMDRFPSLTKRDKGRFIRVGEKNPPLDPPLPKGDV